MPGGQGDGLRIGQGAGLASLWRGEEPVVAVVGDAQPDFFRRDLCKGILRHTPHLIQRGHRHRRAEGVAPLVGHQEDPVRRFPQAAVIMALVQFSLLTGGGFGRQGGQQGIPQGLQTLPQ